MDIKIGALALAGICCLVLAIGFEEEGGDFFEFCCPHGSGDYGDLYD